VPTLTWELHSLNTEELVDDKSPRVAFVFQMATWFMLEMSLGSGLAVLSFF